MADPADWAKHPHSVSLGSAAQSRMLPRLSDAFLSSPAQNNLLAPDWHKKCVCARVCVCAHFSLLLLFVIFLAFSLPWSLAWPCSVCWYSAPHTSFIPGQADSDTNNQKHWDFSTPAQPVSKILLFLFVFHVICDGLCCFPYFTLLFSPNSLICFFKFIFLVEMSGNTMTSTAITVE